MEEEEEDAPAPAAKSSKGKKDKKGKKDMNSLFAALEEDGAAGMQCIYTYYAPLSCCADGRGNHLLNF